MQNHHPFHLELNEPEALEYYLQTQGWLAPGENILRLEKPGEGNMNCVARAITGERSLIVKQARPWVEKYPAIAAPTERALVEARFYQTIQADDFLKKNMPHPLGFDSENFLLVLEDLGSGTDCLHLYRRDARLSNEDAALTGEFLSRLHRLPLTDHERLTFPKNLALRRLNHEHIFQFPYSNHTGFDLDAVQPGLQAAALPFRRDEALKTRIRELGDLYLAVGKTLLHGDFYPGSWLRTPGGLRVIDPEFCFLGCAEFDFGVMAAHAEMAHLAAESRRVLLDAYSPVAGFDETLARAFTGAEILRRLIGLAQLPLERSLTEREELLERARGMVTG